VAKGCCGSLTTARQFLMDAAATFEHRTVKIVEEIVLFNHGGRVSGGCSQSAPSASRAASIASIASLISSPIARSFIVSMCLSARSKNGCRTTSSRGSRFLSRRSMNRRLVSSRSPGRRASFQTPDRFRTSLSRSSSAGWCWSLCLGHRTGVSIGTFGRQPIRQAGTASIPGTSRGILPALSSLAVETAEWSVRPWSWW
jgi:hypothetical protein